MKKKLSVLALLTVGLSLFVLPAWGQGEASPSAVREIREKVKEMVRQKIDEVKKGQKGAYAGEITKISGDLITISTLTNKQSQVRVGEETKIIGSAKKEIKADGLKIGDFIIAMGYLGENEVLEAKRVIVATKPKPLSRQVAFGKVTDISVEERILTVKNEKRDLTYTVLVTNNATITKKVGVKIQKIDFSKIEKGDRIVAIGTVKENGEKMLTTKLIHVIPGNPPAGGPSPTP